MIKRVNDWPARLDEYFEACKDRPFKYGVFDCALYACGAIQAMTGVRPLEKYIGTYGDRFAAAKAMVKFSGGGLAKTAEKVCQSLGMVPAVPEFARRGGQVILSMYGVKAWGVVDLSGAGVRCVGVGSAPDENGYPIIPDDHEIKGTAVVSNNFIVSAWNFE